MALQLEDVHDVLSFKYPHMDIVYMLDHSSGHARKRSDGLHAGSMNAGYGGAQPKMHATTIAEVGPYTSLLQVGDIQHMVFKEGDIGPWYLSPIEREQRKFDMETREVQKKKQRMS